MNLKEAVDKLEMLLETVVNRGINLITEDKIYDFKNSKAGYYKAEIDTLINEIKKYKSMVDNPGLVDKLNLMNAEELLKNVKLLKELKVKDKEVKLDLKVTFLPDEIRDEIKADLDEMEKCYNVASYRATTILCGRILETALHRKYYDVTGKDVLETNPGVGLGKLIAKLKEKDANFDPGLTEQIHLVNQVRVFSVHKKSRTFYPSQQQAHAIILYTVDVLGKLFSKK